ncbi:MAG TPA: metal-dependent transcriptional regulator [Chloroflexota bacterium]
MMISHAMEDYLKTIYKLQRGQEVVSTSAIAEQLRVSPASATNMIKRLAELKLLEHNPYRGVALTPAGEKIALEVLRHHRLLELYLREALGYSLDQVHDEAERLEHSISEEFEARVDELLGFPTVDPHGDPIPTKDGVLHDPEHVALADVEAGQEVVVRRVSDRDPHRLRYLVEIGLLPGERVELTHKAPFDGPLTLLVGEERREQVIGRDLARDVYVSPEEEPTP